MKIFRKNRRFLIFLLVNLIFISVLHKWFSYVQSNSFSPEIYLKDYAPRSKPNLNNSNNNEFNCDSKANLVSEKVSRKYAQCNQANWITVLDNGTLSYNFDYLTKSSISIEKCEYSFIKWHIDDAQYFVSEPVRIKNGETLDLNEEFFLISCQSNTLSYYKTALARIFKSKLTKKSNHQSLKPINVMMIGLDSVSRSNFLNHLPRSSEYLIKEMKTTILNGFNIVGDGTPAALIPILTGKHEHELPNTIKKTPNTSFVDQVYPFIWRNFSDYLGYATLFSEDWPNTGTFQYKMNGFKDQPTTHYARPYHLYTYNNYMIRSHLWCLNEQSIFENHLAYIRDFMRIYKNNGFFGMLHLNQYSHDSLNNLNLIDDELLKFLQEFSSQTDLNNNTILVIYSDHGPRFTAQRKSKKGLLDERNPIFSIYLPSSFKTNFPNESKNFISNSNRLTTPMDIYNTLMHTISLISKNDTFSYEDNRSLSLFNKTTSNSRTCQQAGIALHWCMCLKRTELIIDKNIELIANKFVSYLNYVLLKDYLNKCHLLKLAQVNKVYLYESYINSNVLEKTNQQIREEARRLNLNLQMHPKLEKDYQEYFFQITVAPSGAMYEFTISLERDLINTNKMSMIKINSDQISRINKYGSTSACIYDTVPSIRQYCFCVNTTETN